MKASWYSQSAGYVLAVALTLVAGGCGQPASEPSGSATPVAESSDDDPSHGGWWCVEHGIPEEECSMCSSRAASDFKAKGDWCEEHNRAASQCFLCDPARAAKFTKLYEAKYGEKPPQPTE